MEKRKRLPKGALRKALMERDFSGMTKAEIARELGTTCTSVGDAIFRLWNEDGVEVAYLDGRSARRIRRLQAEERGGATDGR